LLTIWVTPEDRFAKLGTPRPYCLNTGFSGVPNGPVHYSGVNKQCELSITLQTSPTDMPDYQCPVR
jgi:hypothetical protein